MKRRDVMKLMALGTVADASELFGRRTEAIAQTYSNATGGLPPLKITGVKAICTAPYRVNLVVVKVETNEPGLYGIGCATWRQRPLVTVTAVNEYLSNFAKGCNADNIEDMWHSAYVSSYFKNGPVLNAALSGLDQALWDIKGKRANMPVYQLLGGKCRFAVDCYAHANGRDLQELEDSVHRYMEEGYRHIRIQGGGYQMSSEEADFKKEGFGKPDDAYVPVGPYVRIVPRAFEHIRNTCGDEIELLHDMVYTRIPPIDAINMIIELEQYRPYFIEDPFNPEHNGYFRMLRDSTKVPLAMGELFTNPNEWLDLISERLIDFIRCHVSQIGGITPALKLARFCEWFNVRTAWHGPNAVSPVGHAANAHIDLAVWNFGIQEEITFNQETRDVFPGTPIIKNGYMYVNEVPGLGVDVDEKLAAKFPFVKGYGNMRPMRRGDGTIIHR